MQQKIPQFLSMRNKNPDHETLLGRKLPHDIPLERKILATLFMKKPDRDILDFVTEQHFYSPIHGAIYKAILVFYKQGHEIDPTLVINELENEGAFSSNEIHMTILTLHEEDFIAGDATKYVELLHDFMIRRNYLKQQIMNMLACYDSRINETGAIIAQGVKNISSLQDATFFLTDEHVKDIAFGTLQELAEERQICQEGGINGVPGIPTGHHNLDLLLKGFHKELVTLIAARPGMGKTTFSIDIARRALERGYGVQYFSLEVSKNKIISKMAAIHGQMDYDIIQGASFTSEEWSQFNDHVSDIAKYPLYIDDKTKDLYALCSSIRMRHKESKISLVIIDYMGRINGARESKMETTNEFYGRVTNELKTLATELKIHIILLAQLSRSSEKRLDKRPLDIDIRDSGRVEENADNLLFIYRDKEQEKEDRQHGEVSHQMELIVRKNKYGDENTVYFNWTPKTGKYEEEGCAY